jgi:tartrate dehydratase beta subunit/fumarate hydratase class I family protein
MTILLSTSLSKQVAVELCAGDKVALSGPLLVLNLPRATPDAPVETWLPMAPAAGEGWVCCLAVAPVDVAPRAWLVAHFDEPKADRVACALLAAGSRGLVCRGRCPATTSYALRKYGGVCFGVSERWLLDRGVRESFIAVATADPGSAVLIRVQEAELMVSHDAHGRQVAVDA